MYRVQLRLSKGKAVRYLSHRDFIRAFERTLKRSRVPIAYSEGFNPRPRMSFGQAIGVGVTSDDERILLELTHPVNPSEIMEALNKNLPDGIAVLASEEVPEGTKSPISRLNASEFLIDCVCAMKEMVGALEKLMSSSEVKVRRIRDNKVKEVDIRPYITSVEIVNSSDEVVSVGVVLRTGISGGAAPGDFVEALKKYVPNLQICGIHRMRIF